MDIGAGKTKTGKKKPRRAMKGTKSRNGNQAIESILSQKPKQANAFCCSLRLFVARFGFLWMFPFEHRIARCGFLLVRKTKTSNKRQKKSKWKPGFTENKF